MEECIQHFSHEHPLSFFQVDDDEDPKPYRCSICGLPILSSPSYTCSIDANCNFFLHKTCTELPKEFYHRGHLDTLNLEQAKLPLGDSYNVGESCQNFTYKCRNYSHCKFELHPLVTGAVQIKSKHKSHISHPLLAFCREIMALCIGCGDEQKGFFFYCPECNFWIHQDCTIMPSVVKLPSHHPHPFILSYAVPYLPPNSLSTSDELSALGCSICRGPWLLPNCGVYFCGECFSFAHVTCVKSSMENLQTETSLEIMQLPDLEDTFPSLVIRRFVEKNPSCQNNDDDDKKYHKHPLMLEDGTNMSSTSRETSRNLVCDVCIQPINISSPFYRCQQLQSDDCHFLAHDICANHLPASVETFFQLTGFRKAVRSSDHMEYMTQFRKAVLRSSDHMEYFFNSVIPCCCCRHPSNGFCYLVDGSLPCDLECTVAPKTIKHASHRQHLLFQASRFSDTSILLNCCSRESLGFDIYRCAICDFYIHIRCALLPKKTWHKFDEHPLDLIMTPHNEVEEQEYCCFCEFCEGDIDRQHWYYGCGKCENYFHINCIPSVGHMSKVKFGKTLVDENVHPHHPLTLTRMLAVGRHERCGVCNQIIKGFVDDEMAFHCSHCDFWIHFSCARNSSSHTESLVYSEFVIVYELLLRNYHHNN